MGNKTFAKELSQLLHQVLSEFKSSGKITRSLIDAYDILGNELVGVGKTQREIYDFFWDYIVDDVPFEKLGKIEDDFEKAFLILETEICEDKSRETGPVKNS